MWASKPRNQARTTSKINSLHWIDGTFSISNDNTAETDCPPHGDGGWMLFGGGKGELGVSWIERGHDDSYSEENICHTQDGSLYKSHFNLRGHSGGVKFVRWKPQGDKFISYDSWGNVCIWNNRSNIYALDFEFTTVIPVSDIQWSPCGTYIAICGEEGQLQIIAGHNGTTIFAIHAISTSSYGTYAEFTSLSWSASSTRIALGTRKGEVIEVDPHQNGQFLSMMTMHENVPVRKVEYFSSPHCFKETINPDNYSRHKENDSTQSLSLYMDDGEVAIFPTASETHCNCVQTRIVDGVASWNNSQTLLAIVGYRANSPSVFMARLLNSDANVLLSMQLLLTLPSEPCNHCDTHQFKLCWGLQDSVIFIGHGYTLTSIDIQREVPSLQLLCREFINTKAGSRRRIQQLPLPKKEKMILNTMRSSLLSPPAFNILLRLPDTTCFHRYHECLLPPLPHNHRLHCIITTDRQQEQGEITDSTGQELSYTLKYEYFGAYIPLLQATKKPKGFQHVGFDIKPPIEHSQEDRRGRSLCWANVVPNNGRQRRRNSWSCDSTSRLGKLKRAIGQLRPRSTILDAPVQQDTHEEHDRVGSDDWLQLETESTARHSPVLAELNGNKVLNKFKATTVQDKLSSNPIALVNITSHHLKCDPRDISISLYNGNESVTHLTSKKPEWNSRFRVFELDFGGRINRDSVKNFQVEQNGRIVLQFGRSSFNDYCLDFQDPFSPVTALCIALSAMHSS